MIVLDASAAVEWLLRTSAGVQIERRIYSRGESRTHPTFAISKRQIGCGGLSPAASAKRGEEALDDLVALRITRYPHDLLLARVWQLRQNLSAYDACYVSLAEGLGAVTAPGHQARSEVF